MNWRETKSHSPKILITDVPEGRLLLQMTRHSVTLTLTYYTTTTHLFHFKSPYRKEIKRTFEAIKADPYPTMLANRL